MRKRVAEFLENMVKNIYRLAMIFVTIFKRVFKRSYVQHQHSDTLGSEVRQKDLANFVAVRSAHVLGINGSIIFLGKYALALAYSQSEQFDTPLFSFISISTFLFAILHIFVLSVQYIIGLGEVLRCLGANEWDDRAVRLELKRYGRIVSWMRFYIPCVTVLSVTYILLYLSPTVGQYMVDIFLVPTILGLYYLTNNRKHPDKQRLAWLLFILEIMVAIVTKCSGIGDPSSIRFVEISLLLGFIMYWDRSWLYALWKVSVKDIQRMVIASMGVIVMILVSGIGALFLQVFYGIYNSQVEMEDIKVVLNRNDLDHYVITVRGTVPPSIKAVRINGKDVNEADKILISTITIRGEQNLFSRLVHLIKNNIHYEHAYIVNVAPYLINGKNSIEVYYEQKIHLFLPTRIYSATHDEILRKTFLVVEKRPPS